jgi:RNA polymerase sigma factor (sigma-70 family)
MNVRKGNSMTSNPPSRGPTEEQRFRAIHAANYRDLVRFVERRNGGNDSEDIVSAVFLTAWRRVVDMPEDARPWLFGIARNLLANDTRGFHRKRALDVSLDEAPEAQQTDKAEDSDNRLDFARAWDHLDTQDRETLALVAFDGLTTAEAATVLGCRRSTFTMRLTRARRRLRDALNSGEENAPTTTPLAAKEQSWSHV